jgi:hypothetical protein
LRRLAAFTLLAALIAAAPAFADEPALSPLPPPARPSEPAPAATPAPPARGLNEIMKADPACRAFTNECEICKRSEAGPQCSTPGIACQPKAWRCQKL